MELLWTPRSFRFKVLIVAGVTALTLGVHYGWLVEPFFGHVHWLHAIHGRFCYIPIVIAAAWFGIRGGVVTAAAISILILPYVLGFVSEPRDFAGEIAEIVFYFAIAILIGVLVEREFKARREQQEAQLQVERTQKLALAGRIAAGVAHEIKNPLASIKGAADILTDDDTSRGDRQEFKEILRGEIRRIDSTVAEFLEFARPKEAKLQKLDLSTTLYATLRQIENHANREGVMIEYDIEDNIAVNGDAEKLHQMTLNLMLNAIDASSSGNTIRVTLTKSGRHARLRIADEGVGISEADLERVFEPFFTRKSSGTGLGLSVVKAIVDTHGGDIRFESETGHGTTATVALPLYTR